MTRREAINVLKQHPRVEKVRRARFIVTGDGFSAGSFLRIITNDVYIYNLDRDVRKKLGKFKIRMPVQSNKAKVRSKIARPGLFNPCLSICGPNHPHVEQQMLCGRYKALDSALGDGDPATAFEHILRFLETTQYTNLSGDYSFHSTSYLGKNPIEYKTKVGTWTTNRAKWLGLPKTKSPTISPKKIRSTFSFVKNDYIWK